MYDLMDFCDETLSAKIRRFLSKRIFIKLKFRNESQRKQFLPHKFSFSSRSVMYQIRDFHVLACKFANGAFSVCDDFKPIERVEELHLWKFPFKNWFFRLIQDLHSKLSCHDCFIASFWICFLLSTYGLGEAIFEFCHIYNDESYEPKTFWNRSYNHMSHDVRRAARYFGSILNIATNFFLLYGFISFRYLYIISWLVLIGIIVPLESIIWLSQLATHKSAKLKPLIAIMILAVRFAVTLHVMMMMQEFVEKQ